MLLPADENSRRQEGRTQRHEFYSQFREGRRVGVAFWAKFRSRSSYDNRNHDDTDIVELNIALLQFALMR